MQVGYKDKRPGYVFAEDTPHNQFQVVGVISGEVRLRSAQEEQDVLPGQLIVLGYGCHFRLSCPRRAYRGVFAITHDGLSTRHQVGAAALAGTAESRQLVGWLDSELSGTDPDNEHLLACLGGALCELALRLRRHQGRGEPQEATSRYWAERVRQVLDRNLQTPASVEVLLGGWELGQRQLTRHFQRAYGCTPKQYQLQRRLDEGRRMLTHSRLSVTSIAMELGFPSSQHFATRFRLAEGVSPSQYRAGRRAVSQVAR